MELDASMQAALRAYCQYETSLKAIEQDDAPGTGAGSGAGHRKF